MIAWRAMLEKKPIAETYKGADPKPYGSILATPVHSDEAGGKTVIGAVSIDSGREDDLLLHQPRLYSKSSHT